MLAEQKRKSNRVAASPPAVLDITKLPDLDPASYVPLYAQLADRLEGLIRSFPETSETRRLPSEAECIERFRVSRPTVRQAMARLTSQGLIVRGRGRGTFVAPQRIDRDLRRTLEEEMRAANRAVRFKLLDWRSVEPTQAMRGALGLRETDRVEHITRVRLIEGEAFGIEERFVSSEYASRITKKALRELPIVSLISEITGESPVRFTATVSSIPADAASAKALGIKRGVPLLSSEHIYYTTAGRPLLYGIALFHGSQYQFTFQIPIVESTNSPRLYGLPSTTASPKGTRWQNSPSPVPQNLGRRSASTRK